MNKDDVMFLIQYKSLGSSSRGILSGGVILSLEDLYDRNYMHKILKYQWSMLYQVGRSPLQSVKSMRLEEFEHIFGIGASSKLRHLLDFNKDIPSPFRKEILSVYGAEAYEVKPHMTTRYKSGDIITGHDGYNYLYYGNVKNLNIKIEGNQVGEFSGHLYSYLINGKVPVDDPFDVLKLLANSPSKYKKYILKTKRKAVANQIRPSGLTLTGHHDMKFIIPSSYIYRWERKVHVIMDIGD